MIQKLKTGISTHWNGEFTAWVLKEVFPSVVKRTFSRNSNLFCPPAAPAVLVFALLTWCLSLLQNYCCPGAPKSIFFFGLFCFFKVCPRLLFLSFRQSTWPAVTGEAAVTPQSGTTPACRTWSSTASMWSSLKACSPCCSPGPTGPTLTRWLSASSVSWTKTATLSSTSETSSVAWVSGNGLWRSRHLCNLSGELILSELPNSLVFFLGVLCHGDLTEKLKLLYKIHVLPGECVCRQIGDCGKPSPNHI